MRKKTRAERIARLRPLVQDAIRRDSLRAVSREIGITHTAARNFATLGYTPQDRTLEKLEAWATLHELFTDAPEPSTPPAAARVLAAEGGLSPAATLKVRELLRQILAIIEDGAGDETPGVARE